MAATKKKTSSVHIGDMPRAGGIVRGTPTRVTSKPTAQTPALKITTIPGTPGVLNAPVLPFKTKGDLSDEDTARTTHDSGFSTLDEALRRLGADIGLKINGIGGINDVEARNTVGAKDNTDVRGLSNSGIRTAALTDIAGAATAQRAALNDQFDRMAFDNTVQKSIIDDAWTNFQTHLGEKMVQNASDAIADMPKYKVEPTAAKTINTPTSAASSAVAQAGQHMLPKAAAKPKGPATQLITSRVGLPQPGDTSHPAYGPSVSGAGGGPGYGGKPSPAKKGKSLRLGAPVTTNVARPKY